MPIYNGGNGKDTIRAAGGVDRIKGGRGADSVFTLGDGSIDVVDLVDKTRDTIHADESDEISIDTSTGTGTIDQLFNT